MKTVAVILLALVACSKNDPKPVFDLAGKWSISSTTTIGNVTFKRSGNNLIIPSDTTQKLFILDYEYKITSGGYASYYYDNGGYGNSTVGFQINATSKNSCVSSPDNYPTIIFSTFSGQSSTDFNHITFTTYSLHKEVCEGYYNNINEILTMTRIP